MGRAQRRPWRQWRQQRHRRRRSRRKHRQHNWSDQRREVFAFAAHTYASAQGSSRTHARVGPGSPWPAGRRIAPVTLHDSSTPLMDAIKYARVWQFRRHPTCPRAKWRHRRLCYQKVCPQHRNIQGNVLNARQQLFGLQLSKFYTCTAAAGCTLHFGFVLRTVRVQARIPELC